MKDYQSLTVLIADETSNMRKILVNMLKEIGIHQVTQVENGQQAFEEIICGNVDIVFSEWSLTEMSGLELLKTLRGADEFKTLPFVMVTSETLKENVVEAAQAGVTTYIVKPFTSQVLKSKIDYILSKKTLEI